MPSKPQSPGPNPTTSQPKQARSRKAANETAQTVSGRAGSAGGIVLDKEQAAKKTSFAAPKETAKATTAPPAAATDAATTTATTATGPNRQRRRPRKLNKEPAPEHPAASASASTAAIDVAPPSTAELEALKSRVRGLEAKVEELYQSAETRPGRSPRRRGKGRKASSTQVPTASAAEPAQVEDAEEEEADEELVRLEGELEVARRDLEHFRPRTRPRGKRATSGDTEYVEEIPRDDIGGVEDTVSTGDRQVTLAGSYRIPLPSSVSMNDVKNIQSGVSAAQNVAKSFLEQRRAAQAAQPPKQAAPKAAPKPSKKASGSMEISKETQGSSWSEWFGGYSMAISRAVKNIEAEAAIESQKRPVQTRTTSAPSGAKRTGAGASGAAKAGGQRPGMKARQGNVSSEQVHGLMS